MNRIKIFLLCLGLISCTYSFSQEETLEVLLEKQNLAMQIISTN